MVYITVCVYITIGWDGWAGRSVCVKAGQAAGGVSRAGSGGMTSKRDRATALIYKRLLAQTYRDAPDESKVTAALPTLGTCTFGAASMCGWRRSQEDRFLLHATQDAAAIVGVFDGHGGCSVAALCEGYMARTIDALRRTQASAGAALVDAFLAVDAAMARASEEVLALPVSEPWRVSGAAILGGAAILASAASGLLQTRKVQGVAVAITGAALVAVAATRFWHQPETITLEVAARAVDAAEVGATAVCAIVTPESSGAAVTVANAGDCRAVVSLHLGAAAEAITTDHKPTVRAEKRRILLADSPLGTVDKVTRRCLHLGARRAAPPVWSLGHPIRTASTQM